MEKRIDVTSPLLTIAIPTYNGAKTIKTMMDILLNQYDKRVEILVSDNCSTDQIPCIIKDYQARYPFIKYVRHNKNIGADANFLYCMKIASGKFIYLLSDDDVLIEGTLQHILNYLEKYDDVSLLYLNSVAFYGKYKGLENCVKLKYAETEAYDLYTTDKKRFIKCAARFWGFMSSFIISREKFLKIDKPEQFFGTYWLQSYIHILCSAGKDTKIGVISKPCLAAGIYIDINNFDSGEINGINYKKMIDFSIEKGGYDKHQMKKLYIWHLIYLSSHSIIKEKAANIKKTSYLNLFHNTYKYPIAWIKLYPIFFIPKWLCRLGMNYYRRKKSLNKNIVLSREGDTKS